MPNRNSLPAALITALAAVFYGVGAGYASAFLIPSHTISRLAPTLPSHSLLLPPAFDRYSACNLDIRNARLLSNKLTISNEQEHDDCTTVTRTSRTPSLIESAIICSVAAAALMGSPSTCSAIDGTSSGSGSGSAGMGYDIIDWNGTGSGGVPMSPTSQAQFANPNPKKEPPAAKSSAGTSTNAADKSDDAEPENTSTPSDGAEASKATPADDLKTNLLTSPDPTKAGRGGDVGAENVVVVEDKKKSTEDEIVGEEGVVADAAASAASDGADTSVKKEVDAAGDERTETASDVNIDAATTATGEEATGKVDILAQKEAGIAADDKTVGFQNAKMKEEIAAGTAREEADAADKKEEDVAMGKTIGSQNVELDAASSADKNIEIQDADINAGSATGSAEDNGDTAAKTEMTDTVANTKSTDDDTSGDNAVVSKDESKTDANTESGIENERQRQELSSAPLPIEPPSVEYQAKATDELSSSDNAVVSTGETKPDADAESQLEKETQQQQELPSPSLPPPPSAKPSFDYQAAADELFASPPTPTPKIDAKVKGKRQKATAAPVDPIIEELSFKLFDTRSDDGK